MIPSLHGVWAKVERAKEHRDALQAYITEAFAIETSRPRLGAKFDPDRGQNVLYVNRLPDTLPAVYERSSLILGDAINCLRAALDHLVFQLAARTPTGITDERQLAFPITDSPALWKSACKRWLSQVSPTDRTIIERYQGYHRIDIQLFVGTYFHPLVMLRDLNDTDKHRLLNTVAIPDTGWQVTTGVAEEITLAGMLDFTEKMLTVGPTQGPTPIELGAVIASTRHMEPLQTEVIVAGYVTPDIALEEGRSVVAVLDKIAGVVVRVIREFEPFP